MKMTAYRNITAFTVLAALLAFGLSLFQTPVRTQMLVYPLVRQGAQVKLNFETRNMSKLETEHFIIKYTPADTGHVQMIARAAEQAYQPVTAKLGFAPPAKTLLVVYPDKNELRKAFGWSSNESAMGVYWGGVIQLLSPQAWLNDGDSLEEFIQTGPMVHEFTHLVFDHMTNGNYPRWFTEGLAQYVEYQVNNYEWVVPGNTLRQELYTMEQLGGDFDALSNQALAYRQSLAAVRYIAEVHGEDSLKQVIAGLETGQSVEAAISKAVNMDYAAFEQAWQKWAGAHMKEA